MTVTELDIAVPDNRRFRNKVEIDVLLATSTRGVEAYVGFTNTVKGVYAPRNGETRVWVEYLGQLWCLLRFKWDPVSLLKVAIPPGPFDSLRQLFVANDAGVGTITVEVLSESPLTHAVSVQKSATDTFRILQRFVAMDGEGQQFHTLKVGQTVAPARQVSATSEPTGLCFNPAAPMTAALDLVAMSQEECTLARVFQPPTAEEPVPFEMDYSWPAPPGSASAARFEVPAIVQLAGATAVQFGSGGARLLHARREGNQALTSEPSNVDSRYEFPGFIDSRKDTYRVDAVTLGATFTPAPGDTRDGKILFEDRWDPDPTHPRGGRLVSSFRLEVTREGETLYRSWEPARMVMERSPDRLLVKAIFKTDAGGVERRMPFQLSIRSSNPNMVQFWLKAGESGADPVNRALIDVMEAIGYGEPCEISVRFLQLDEPVPLDVDVYKFPVAPTPLDVLIPAPLIADVKTWQDEYYTPARPPRDLDAFPVSEVIFASGQLAGEVKNREPLSTSEQITLTLTPESAGQAQPLTVVFATGAADDQFTSAVSGLRLGNNVLTLKAEKPINWVTTGPSTETVTLQGVRPRDVSLQGIDGQQNGAIVLRRALGRFDWTYARAARARLRYSMPSGESDLRLLGISFDLASARDDVTLSRVVGSHALRVVAENDFGFAESAAFSVEAKAPELSVAFQTAALPHAPEDSMHVGHSVTEVDVRVTVRFTLSFEVAHDGTAFVSRAPGTPLVTVNETFSVPPGGLDVGENLFTFPFRNEFADGNINRIVRRRDDVFDTVGLIKIDTNYDHELEAVVEVVEIRPAGFANLVPGGVSGVIEVPIDVRDSSSPIGFESMKWRIIDRDEGNDTDPDTMDYRAFCEVFTIDPDFVRNAVFMDISPGNVDIYDPDSQPFNLGLLADWTGLTLPEEDDGSDIRYWEQARIYARSSPLLIRLRTRRLIT